MPAVALLLALAAACVHALWNLLLARARDPQAATAVAMVVAVVSFAPVAAAFWRADGQVWPYAGASAALELVYFTLLASAYRRAALSVVYPLARGTAPVLVLVVGVAAFGAATSWRQAAGVVVVGAGVVLVRGTRRGAGAGGTAFAVAIAACIAAYTLVDKHGIRHATPLAYLELVMVPPALAYAAAMLRARGVAGLRAAVSSGSVVAGLATFGAYALVLAALQRASAASVAAVRETSVVVATALAARVLHERVGPARIAGAILVAGGIALLSLG